MQCSQSMQVCKPMADFLTEVIAPESNLTPGFVQVPAEKRTASKGGFWPLTEINHVSLKRKMLHDRHSSVQVNTVLVLINTEACLQSTTLLMQKPFFKKRKLVKWLLMDAKTLCTNSILFAQGSECFLMIHKFKWLKSVSTNQHLRFTYLNKILKVHSFKVALKLFINYKREDKLLHSSSTIINLTSNKTFESIDEERWGKTKKKWQVSPNWESGQDPGTGKGLVGKLKQLLEDGL